MDKIILTEVYTDGLGTYRARCQECDWLGRWWRDESRATKDARSHGASHA